jgi:sarcosine oxidase subunit delta
MKSIEFLNFSIFNIHLVGNFYKISPTADESDVGTKKGKIKMAATLTCPICGKRNGYEFRYGGVDKGPRPAEEVLSPATWCDYVHMNKCIAGIQKEWWFHRDGCGAWFTTHRDTTTNLEVKNPEVN